ncbi:HNH endonuclease [Polystyrenella longa]
MREVSPGDLVFSFRRRKIPAVGVASSYCYEAPKPDEFGTAGQNWEKVGWRVDVAYTEMSEPITPKAHIDVIRPLLPGKYSPLQQNGDGLQSVYLAAISRELADLLQQLLEGAGNPRVDTDNISQLDRSDLVHEELERQIEDQIDQSIEIESTEKQQLVKSRRGQGLFRLNVQEYEKACRISGVCDTRFLIASHIKPWRSSTNVERLDGENGLFLSPNIDSLFDRGFISFDDNGNLLVSPVLDTQVMSQLGVPAVQSLNVGRFTSGQMKYLAHHRREVFLESGRQS